MLREVVYSTFRMMQDAFLTTCGGALVGVSIFVGDCAKKKGTPTHTHTLTPTHTHTHTHTHTQKRFVSWLAINSYSKDV